MLYLYYVFSLILFVYVAPGLAFFPQLVVSPLGIATVPVVSVCIVGVITTLLLNIGLFNSLSVPLCSVALALVAFYRVREYKLTKISSAQMGWMLFIILACLPYMAKLGITGFDSSDEMYSWNVWALQYFHGWVSPDFYNVTAAPYPQLFPKLIAYCYQWCGSTELQLPVKASLIMISGSFMALLCWIYPNNKTIISRLLLIVLVVFGANLQRYFSYAYADPLMSALLLASIGFFWSWQQTFQNRSLILSVLLAIGACYTKQPAFIWTLFSLPVLLLTTAPREKRSQALVASICLISAGLYWLLGPGAGVTDNGGVLNASFAGRTHFEQLVHSISMHLIKNPVVGLLFLWTAFQATQKRMVGKIFIFWLLPSMVAWLVFGAYDLRLGMHCVLGMAFLTIVSGLPQWNFRIRPSLALPLLAVGTVGSFLSTGLIIQKSLLYQQDLSVYHSGQVTLGKYFGEDSPVIYDTLYNQQELIMWAPTDYITALFYMKANIFRPSWVRFDSYNTSQVTPFTKQLLVQELSEVSPDIVFTGGRVANRGSIASRSLEALAEQNPDIFIPFATSPNRYGYKTFKVDKQKLKQLQLVLQTD